MSNELMFPAQAQKAFINRFFQGSWNYKFTKKLSYGAKCAFCACPVLADVLT